MQYKQKIAEVAKEQVILTLSKVLSDLCGLLFQSFLPKQSWQSGKGFPSYCPSPPENLREPERNRRLALQRDQRPSRNDWLHIEFHAFEETDAGGR
jgi:hypothetical protein